MIKTIENKIKEDKKKKQKRKEISITNKKHKMEDKITHERGALSEENYRENTDQRYLRLFNEAYHELLNKENNYKTKITFSNRFNDYNANITLNKSKRIIELRLSKKWQLISDEILKGLFQELLMKIFLKNKKEITFNIELYRRFIRNLDAVTTVNVENNEKLNEDNKNLKNGKNTEVEKNQKNKNNKNDNFLILLDSFNRINERFFNNSLDLCNLKFGRNSKNTAGTYNYHTDTIILSNLLRNANKELLDFVMYHEMLHKYLKFEIENNWSHTKEFRELESQYPNYQNIEDELFRFLSKEKQKMELSQQKKELNQKQNNKNRNKDITGKNKRKRYSKLKKFFGI